MRLATANVTTYDSGYVKWYGVFDPTNTTWALYALGYMRNPTGSAQPVIRREDKPTGSPIQGPDKAGE